jgi:uncharacterized membrane protein YphA (DoxX/SURF4 family)
MKTEHPKWPCKWPVSSYVWSGITAPQGTFMNRISNLQLAKLFLRWSLGLTFLSACADRFGLWGPPGSQYAAWGDWAHFVAYSETLNWFLPAWMQSPVAWLATIAELSFGIALVLGVRLREAACGSAVLLGLFALAMTFSLGIKAPLNYSVFVDACAAWLLFAVA